MDDADVLRAILSAYQAVMGASWPGLHPMMADRAAGWPTASQATLAGELAEYLQASAQSKQQVRVFWKFAPDFRFGGCNELFARDAGMKRPEELVGTDDFDRRLPWGHQAAKYRQDDEAVYKSGTAKLDILERQQSTTGITWVRAGKTPMRKANGEIIGIFGMYELLDAETGRKLFAARNVKRKS
ncbi:MAG TPA: hypothetical protein VH439_11915 [Gemmatimonadales bacterium]|jgi:hypothetical protein